MRAEEISEADSRQPLRRRYVGSWTRVFTKFAGNYPNVTGDNVGDSPAVDAVIPQLTKKRSGRVCICIESNREALTLITDI